MPKFNVTVLVDATTTIEIEANDPLEARELAIGAASVCLCHQCSDSLDVGDPIRVIEVCDEDGNVIEEQAQEPKW